MDNSNRRVWKSGLFGIVACLALSPTVAHADPNPDVPSELSSIATPNGSHLESITNVDARHSVLVVFSASMQRMISVEVMRAADSSVPRPSLYLLDGVTRESKTDSLAFLGDKNVNVVIPTGGENAWWTDWNKPDPVLGVNKWQTFLTKELPPIIDATFGTSGRNAAAGMSRTGTAALQLAISSPGLYQAVASYSGCANSSGPLGQAFVRLSMNEYGGGNPVNMWGPPGDPAWAANDSYVNAAGLRGVALYISNGSGIPGPYERLDAPGVDGDIGALAGQIAVGGGIEAVTNYCTHQLADRLNALGIPATFDFRPTGTHSWNYWRDDLVKSWPVIAGALGI